MEASVCTYRRPIIVLTILHNQITNETSNALKVSEWVECDEWMCAWASELVRSLHLQKKHKHQHNPPIYPSFEPNVLKGLRSAFYRDSLLKQTFARTDMTRNWKKYIIHDIKRRPKKNVSQTDTQTDKKRDLSRDSDIVASILLSISILKPTQILHSYIDVRINLITKHRRPTLNKCIYST